MSLSFWVWLLNNTTCCYTATQYLYIFLFLVKYRILIGRFEIIERYDVINDIISKKATKTLDE